MNGRIKYIVFILLFSSCLIVNAQDKSLQFENLSTKHGLPHSSINHILEDHLGFLWFATNSGLFRYDGYDLKEYLHDVHDSSSIASPGVHYVVEDQIGRIWISTLYGINLLDRRTGTFKHFLPFPSEISSKGKNIIRGLHVDQSNRLFALGGRNLFLFDEETSSFKMINRVDKIDIQYSLGSIIETDNGTIWCKASTGLIKIAPGDTLFTFIQLDTEDESDYNKGISVVASAYDDKVWVYTSAGLALFDPVSLSLKKDIIPKNFRSERIQIITQISNGSLLLAFANNGIGVLKSNGTFQHYFHSDEKFNSLHSNHITFFLEDQFKNIWLGTEAGISKITTDKSGFKLLQNKRGLDQRTNNVFKLHKDREGVIWMDTDLGIYAKSKKDNFGYPVQIHPKIDKPARTNFIYEDKKGSIWIPVRNHGIWKKEKSASKFKEIPLDENLKNALIYKIIDDYAEDQTIWLGTTQGLCKLNTETLQYSIHKPRDQLTEIRSNRVIVFAEFGDEIWLYYTFYNSIGRFDKQTEKFELVRPPAHQQYMLEGVFRDMVVSPDGSVWMATNFGLTQYDIKQNKFHIHTKQEGLIDNDLTAVIIDNNNKIWVAGQHFIAKLDRESNNFTCYDVGDDVKRFRSRSKHISENGELLFGCLNGVFTFHPDSINGDQIAPKIILTDFKVNDKSFLLEKAYEYTNSINLNHDQNDISFGFSGIHYSDPSANKYQCYLEGYDKNWRDLGSDHHVSYTNLNPGQFIFRLKAVNKDGFWNEEELKIDVLITPPFTQTNWFRVMIALLVASLLYVVFKNRQHQLTLQTEKDLAEKSAEYKTQFLADVSHEIRTPMNAIIGLSKLTLDTELDKKQFKFISAIQDSSKNLLTIINDLLDHTKLETGKFNFVKKSFELKDITHQLENTFNYKAEEKQLDFEVVLKDEIPHKIIGDPIRLNQILINLLGNSLKFTEQGKVWLHIEKQAETDQTIQLRFEVGDTGIGIPNDKIESIFESFQQADSGINKGMEGTGLGLSIARQLVERQGGQLFIESKLDRGTRLWFDLTFEKVALENQVKTNGENEFTIDRLSILVVEDTYFNQMLVVEILKKHIKNVNIIVVENGKLALEAIVQQSFDLILMDVKMPVMDGFEATKAIRNLTDENLKAIPVLAVTASAVPEQLQKCKAAGMDDYITKPIDENQLMEKIFLLTKRI